MDLGTTRPARRLLLPLLVACACLPATGALAQLTGIGGQGGGIPAAGRNTQGVRPDKPAPAPPDAIPGSKPRDPVAPATRSPSEMAPNEALFDSINRGDIAVARDALNRGAELSAVNVLGLTPLELSVDLGRNDITFMLLSMRGEGADRGSRAIARSEGARPAPARTAAQARPPAPEPVRPAPKPTAPKPTAPRQFAADGGTPVPQAGFLGFGRQGAN
jgi:hypothetical protein